MVGEQKRCKRIIYLLSNCARKCQIGLWEQGKKTLLYDFLVWRPCKQFGWQSRYCEVWGLLFSPDILDTIVKYTNMKINEVRPNYYNYKSHTKD